MCTRLVHKLGQMSKERLLAEIKTRVPIGVRDAFAKLAEERHLTPAVLVREAMRQYLERNTGPCGNVKVNSTPSEVSRPV